MSDQPRLSERMYGQLERHRDRATPIPLASLEQYANEVLKLEWNIVRAGKIVGAMMEYAGKMGGIDWGEVNDWLVETAKLRAEAKRSRPDEALPPT